MGALGGFRWFRVKVGSWVWGRKFEGLVSVGFGIFFCASLLSKSDLLVLRFSNAATQSKIGPTKQRNLATATANAKKTSSKDVLFVLPELRVVVLGMSNSKTLHPKSSLKPKP